MIDAGRNHAARIKKAAPVKIALIAAVVIVVAVAIFALKSHNDNINTHNQIEAAAEAMQKRPAIWTGERSVKNQHPDGTSAASATGSANTTNNAAMTTPGSAAKAAGSNSANTQSDYTSPIDFATLRDENEEVIGWLSIPGTDIDYPIMQSKSDNTYYLDHNISGAQDRNGSLYTEVTYNRDDFSDPVTAIYGHNMASGAMFGNLQETFSQGLDGHDEAIVYMPDTQKKYKLIAALPIGSGHLLYGRNMRDKTTYTDFARSLLNTDDTAAVIAPDAEIAEDGRLLILSTCIGGQPDKRYIVAGVEENYTPEDDNNETEGATSGETSAARNQSGDTSESRSSNTPEIQSSNTTDDRKSGSSSTGTKALGSGSYKSPKTGE